MEPTIKNLNTLETLLNEATFRGRDYTEVNIKRLILRPVLKRIAFLTEEFDRIILFEGDDYETHKNDSDEVLINALLSKIDTLYKK